MHLMAYTFLFLLGLIAGSFLNVVILRYNTGRGMAGRSACFSCGNTLRWHHLLPLASFLLQQGRCRYCKSKISWQYPLVELMTGLLFLAAAHTTGLFSDAFFVSPFSFHLFLLVILAVCLSIIIAVYDFRHMIIPDGIVYTFIALGFVRMISIPGATGSRALATLDFATGLLIFLFFFCLWYFSGGRWIGLGDGKLALAIGWFLPYSQNVAAILFSFWIGALYGIGMLLLQKYAPLPLKHTLSMRSEVPFAPFMILGFLVVLFSNIDLLNILQFFAFS